MIHARVRISQDFKMVDGTTNLNSMTSVVPAMGCKVQNKNSGPSVIRLRRILQYTALRLFSRKVKCPQSISVLNYDELTYPVFKWWIFLALHSDQNFTWSFFDSTINTSCRVNSMRIGWKYHLLMRIEKQKNCFSLFFQQSQARLYRLSLRQEVQSRVESFCQHSTTDPKISSRWNCLCKQFRRCSLVQKGTL